MTPEADNIQFNRQIWQAVSEQAQRCIARSDLRNDQTRTENLRCVHFEEECETDYGKQIWCFEVIGNSSSAERTILYGLLEFSIQYGLLEASQSALFEDPVLREKFILQQSCSLPDKPTSSLSTVFWVCTAWTGVVVLGLVWLTALLQYMFTSPAISQR